MAKLVLTLGALFLLFAISNARTPSELPAKETNRRDPAHTNLPESEPNPASATILLPSEKPDSETSTVFEWVHDTADSKLPDSDGPTILANEESTEFKHSEAVPLTVISFHPVNRHFPRRPFPLSFRHGHPCRHGHRQVRPWTPRFQGGEHERQRDVVSYGDDMILSSGDDMGFDPAFRGGPRQIPARWVRFHHGGPRFPFRHDDDMELESPHHHHHHRHHHEDFEGDEKPREHWHEHEHEHEHHGGGLMRKFRKFLNDF